MSFQTSGGVMFDFNKVRVIGVTQPVVDFIPDSEGILSYAARVSSPQNQDNFETASRLLKYCINHKHYSVFETANIVMEIETTRDIARQILRHRSFSFQEFSQRYAAAQEFAYREARLQDHKNRQNSFELDPSDEDQAFMKAEWNRRQASALLAAQEAYKWALGAGIAKEQARSVLPEGMTMSRMYMNGSVRSWLHYCDVRDDEGVTQLEHVDIAKKCKASILEYFPFLEEVWNKEV